MAEEPVTDPICVDPFELQTHVRQRGGELDRSSRSNADVDQSVGVVRLALRELPMLHAVEQNHLPADKYPAAR